MPMKMRGAAQPTLRAMAFRFVPSRIAACQVAPQRHRRLRGVYLLQPRRIRKEQLVKTFRKPLGFERHVADQFGGASDAANRSAFADRIPFAHIEMAGESAAVGARTSGL